MSRNGLTGFPTTSCENGHVQRRGEMADGAVWFSSPITSVSVQDSRFQGDSSHASGRPSGRDGEIVAQAKAAHFEQHCAGAGGAWEILKRVVIIEIIFKD